MATKVILPQMGEGVTDATITRWIKQVGDEVNEYDPLVEINTDKVDTEVPSPVSGTVLKILPAEGSTVEVDSVLAWIGDKGEDIPKGKGEDTAKKKKAKPEASKQKMVSHSVQPLPVASSPAPAPLPVSPIAATAATAPLSINAPISPLVARIASENNVDLAHVRGSGAGGRITKQDVLNFVQAGASPNVLAGAPTSAADTPLELPKFDGQNMSTFLSPVVKQLVREHNLDVSHIQGSGKDGRITKKDIEATLSAGGMAAIPAAIRPPEASRPKFPVAFPDAVPGEVMKLNPVRKSIAEHMVRSKSTSPHVTSIMEADMSAVFAHRSANKESFAQQGVKLTFTPYFVAAIVTACQAYPIVNSSWTDEGIAVHGQINVGVAAALKPDGLIVPVIKNAASLSLLELARAVGDLSDRARAKQLKPEEVQGGTITITNHGTSGSLFASPIINQPQSAIIGTGMIEKRVIVIDDAIAIRPMVYLGLTFDHRILDGAVADYFLGTIKYRLETWTN